jgi:diguanylate cyclase (GGDEF)-like protein
MLEVLTSTDARTGVMNPRSFDTATDAAISTANRTGRPLAMLRLDVDNFKTINDSRGHGMGDRVLRKLGAAVQNVSRAHEIPARYGGDEFVYVLSDTTVDEAYRLGERMHEAAATLLPETWPITVSIGIFGRTGRTGMTCSDLLEQTDLASYDAKMAGRNISAIRSEGRFKMSKPA